MSLTWIKERLGWLSPPEVVEARSILEVLGRVFVDFELYSSKSFLVTSYILPLKPGHIEVVGGSLIVQIDTSLLPRSVFLEQLEDPRLLSAMKAATGRNVEVRRSASLDYAPDAFREKKSKDRDYQFFYKVELDAGKLRGIPRLFDFDDLPSPPPEHILTLPLGVGQGGQFHCYDFPRDVISLLVCGATRTGKSNFLRVLLTYLGTYYHDDYYSIILADFKKDKTDYRKFINKPNVAYFDDLVKLLDYLDDINGRHATFRSLSGLPLFEHNASDFESLPYTLVIIDELYLMMFSADKKQKERFQAMVATMASNGIYFVLGTQRPSVDIVSGATKTNIVSRLSFSLPTSTDGEVVFGNAEMGKMVERIGAKGRGFCQVSDNFVEFQSPLVD